MDKALINTTIDILIQLVRCIQVKQVLQELDPDPKLNFWRLIHGCFLDVPNLEWCKIFGTDGEPTHWKGIIDDKDAFRKELFSALKLTKDEWATYWNHMHAYRNEFVSHSFINPDTETYPDLTIALRSAYFYYDYLFKMLNDCEVEYPDNLESYSIRFKKQTTEIAQAAIYATFDFKEEVY